MNRNVFRIKENILKTEHWKWKGQNKDFVSQSPFSSVQFSSIAQSCPTLRPYESQHARLMSIESVTPSSHLILCHPLFLLPPIPPSIRVFPNESTLRMRWPKYWSFSFSIIPSKEIPGVISFRMDWLDLLAVQGTLGLSINSLRQLIPNTLGSDIILIIS